MRSKLVRILAGIVIAGCVIGGCSHKPTEDQSSEKTRRGTLSMPLETVSNSGKVYRLRQALFPIFGENDSILLDSDSEPDNPVLEILLAPGDYEMFLAPGWFLERVDTLGNVKRVDATLISPTFRSFRIEENEETFVRFEFEVDGSRVVFGPPGRLITGIEVHERDAGTQPPGGPNPRRVLLETNQSVAGDFSLEQTLLAIQQNSDVEPDPELLYQQVIDSYASEAQSRLPGAVHCGDEMTDGEPTLNGYPILCDRLEAQQFDNLGSWFLTALVNRLDLAPEDGSHCGQQRMIFANNEFIGNGRMFIILEAQIPNPRPECGVSACRPIADFWSGQDDLNDPADRSARLAAAFLTGSEELLEQGFGPFMAIDNLSIGTGNVRTNNFNDFEWTLREFKFMRDPAGQSRAIPFPVGESPHGALWDDTSGLANGEACRESFLSAVDGLLSDDPAELALVVDHECLDAESPNDFFRQDYGFHLSNGSGAFRQALVARLAGTGLTPENIAARARFSGSCIGCHEEANGLFLGRGATAPFSRGFVHVDEFGTEDCGDGTSCFAASEALTDVFLPRRMRAVLDLLNGPNECGETVGDGGTMDGGPSGTEGDASTRPREGGAPSVTKADPVLEPDESVEDLVEQDEAARMARDGHTLGGEPAAVSH